MRTVIFRPTNSCNLRCTYCYDKDNHGEKVIEIRKKANEKFEQEYDNLQKDFRILFNNEKRPNLIFHGGEPLLIYPKNIDSFCNDLNRDISNIKYSIQTNGTLIDKNNIDVFKKYNMNVGVSLDGCNEKQNVNRIFINGKNSFNVVMNKIKLLKDNNVRFGLVMSLVKEHIGGEKQLYDFIGKENLSCDIRPVFASSKDDLSKVMTDEEYSYFFNNLFDIWFDDKDTKVGTHGIVELYHALKEELKPDYSPHLCSESNDCFKNFISLDVDSNLYACNRLYGVNKFYYGNLKSTNMDEVNKKSEELLEIRNNAIKKECSLCNNYSRCYGGCIAESYDLYKDIEHKSSMCKTKKIIKEHVRKRVNE